jgi:hypothetical protein
MDEADEQRKRAAQRASWPIRRFALGEETDDLSAVTTATERIAMMWPLALEAWNLAGLPIPDYTRETMPGRILREGDPDS